MVLKEILSFSAIICSLCALAQQHNDTTFYSFDTGIIKGKKYVAFLNHFGFYLLDGNDTILKRRSDYRTCHFDDFNSDGYKDVFLEISGNTPDQFDLFLYVSKTKSFQQLKGFGNFPSAKRNNGTAYYYSYHKSGCADMNWDSDLFYISNFRAIRIANISGKECGNSGVNDGLYISKVQGDQKTLVKTLPIETIHKFKDDKWEFIKRYWIKNYRIFQ
jgi:hypothetical protein